MEQQRTRQTMKDKINDAYKNVEQFHQFVNEWGNSSKKKSLQKSVDKRLNERKHSQNHALREKINRVDQIRNKYKKVLEKPSQSKNNYGDSQKYQTVRRQPSNIEEETLKKSRRQMEKQSTKPNEQDERIKTVKPSHEANGRGILDLNKGWSYKGEYANQRFHGYGQLFDGEDLIYCGEFKNGYFHGTGKLKYQITFNYLIDRKRLQLFIQKCKNKSTCRNILIQNLEQNVCWTAFIGQFEEGNATGYAELWLDYGIKIIGKFKEGKVQERSSIITQNK